MAVCAATIKSARPAKVVDAAQRCEAYAGRKILPAKYESVAMVRRIRDRHARRLRDKTAEEVIEFYRAAGPGRGRRRPASQGASAQGQLTT